MDPLQKNMINKFKKNNISNNAIRHAKLFQVNLFSNLWNGISVTTKILSQLFQFHLILETPSLESTLCSNTIR
ncbi:MAG: hypothetical protein COB90_00025 [Hyphomicrobiales bacterium]|nr:MAG: hypothetical protein COB90_00025 [Hyphomicrobiales bacterium]